MDLKRICRTCLQSSKESFDIYTTYYLKRNLSYADILCICTKLMIFEDDGLPRLICKECRKRLKRSYDFNLHCIESDAKLRDYVKPFLQNKDEISVKKEENEWDDRICNINSIRKEQVSIILDRNTPIECKREANGDNITLPQTGDDSDFDAEDDNIILENIKTQKETEISETENGIEIVKLKRGRKKKVKEDVVVDSEIEAGVPKSKLPHQCDICGKFLSNKSNLKAHKISHTDLRPYKCKECPATFRGHSALFQHKRMHSGETPYHCEYCPKQFRRRTGFLNHIRMHTGEKTFSCNICFKKFIQSGQLSIHMKRHNGDKSFLCQDCGKGFPLKSDLKVHQRMHNGEKPYSCHLCTKTFATSGNLSIHVRIHNKEIRYHCSVCQRGFVTCSSYNVHIKRHKGQRDYVCECGKTFYTSSALKQHKVVHTGEKKYQCKICERKFTQTSHLSRHFKRDHVKPQPQLPSDHYIDKAILHQLFDIPPKEHLNSSENIKCESS